MTKEQMQAQIDSARKQVRKMKRHMPYIFHEYSRLHSARQRLVAAKAELKTAQLAWDNLGKKKP